MTGKPRLGLIGIGLMGEAMTLRLLERDWSSRASRRRSRTSRRRIGASFFVTPQFAPTVFPSDREQ